jgi:hypothetical protein
MNELFMLTDAQMRRIEAWFPSSQSFARERLSSLPSWLGPVNKMRERLPEPPNSDGRHHRAANRRDGQIHLALKQF